MKLTNRFFAGFRAFERTVGALCKPEAREVGTYLPLQLGFGGKGPYYPARFLEILFSFAHFQSRPPATIRGTPYQSYSTRESLL